MKESEAAFKDSRKMSTISFWDNAATGLYDKFVLGSDAPYDIRRLIAQEDQIVKEVIEGYIANGGNVVFVEIGSGTGRYVNLLSRQILLDKDYRRCLKYVVGCCQSAKWDTF